MVPIIVALAGAPKGVDCCFKNVGVRLEAAINCIALCGIISRLGDDTNRHDDHASNVCDDRPLVRTAIIMIAALPRKALLNAFHPDGSL